MKILRQAFNHYTLLMKKISTFVGTFFIYFSAILIGKIIHMFIGKNSTSKWQNYQSGSVSDKMF